MSSKLFKQLLLEAKSRDSYWVEDAKLQFSIELNRLFEACGISQKQLAEKLNTSPAYITKVFRGDANFTIETMTKLARAVDGELHIHISPKQSKTRWFDILQTVPVQTPTEAGNEWVKAGKKTNERISPAA